LVSKSNRNNTNWGVSLQSINSNRKEEESIRMNLQSRSFIQEPLPYIKKNLYSINLKQHHNNRNEETSSMISYANKEKVNPYSSTRTIDVERSDY
jgi:hypothetical protein